MRVLTAKVRDAAEGRLGPKWQAVYWWLAGRKRGFSTWLAIGAGAAYGLEYPTVAAVIGALAAVGMSLGFVDANWRSEQESSWLKDSAIWRFLAQNSPTITAGALAGVAWLEGAGCTLGDWCLYLKVLLSVVMAVFVQIGAVDAAWNAPAPMVGESQPPQP
jgi:hypothetical protein